MASRCLILSTSIVLLILWLTCARNGAWAQAGTDRVVVLKNGRVLRGKVTYLGDRCLIALAGGGEIRLPTKDLTADCESLESAYLRMRDALVSPQNVKSRLDLASWCLREGLFEPASNELLVAMQLNPSHPEIEPLYRQLKYLSEKPVTPAKPLPPITAAPLDDLEIVTKALRKDVVAEFPSNIQPLLINRCAGGRCHEGNSAAQYKLLRPSQGASYWRRLTLRNLQSTIEQIDLANPDNSPLLVQSTQPHGGLATPVFGDKDSNQFRALVDWVHRAAQRSETAETGSAMAVVTAAYEFEGAAAGPGAVAPASAPSTPATSTAPVPPESPPSTAGDPFDPDIFNRQFGRGAGGR